MYCLVYSWLTEFRTWVTWFEVLLYLHWTWLVTSELKLDLDCNKRKSVSKNNVLRPLCRMGMRILFGQRYAVRFRHDWIRLRNYLDCILISQCGASAVAGMSDTKQKTNFKKQLWWFHSFSGWLVCIILYACKCVWRITVLPVCINNVSMKLFFLPLRWICEWDLGSWEQDVHLLKVLNVPQQQQ